MTTAPAPLDRARWLFGPVPDLLFGCGLAYALVFVVLSWDGAGFRGFFAPGLLPLLSVIGGTPHYGATLLRVYGERENRQKYFFFSVVATALVGMLFVAGLQSATVGSLLLSTYLTWSPWHYTGQNYGVALMFLGRRGVRIEPLEKRLVHLSFLTSYLLVVLSVHGILPNASYAPIQYPGAYRFMTLGLPAGFVMPAFAVTAAAYAVLVAASLGLLLRRASLRDLLPTMLLFLTQALWFSVPSIARHYGVFGSLDPLSLEYTAYVFSWVAFGHAVQYLWVTTYTAQGRRPLGFQLRYYGMCLAAGALLWTLPALVFRGPLAPPLGETSIYVMVLATVNLHHFILDGAIWKLRDGRVARILLRATPPPAAAYGTTRRGWLRAGVVVVGGVLASLTLGTILVGELGFRRSLRSGDLRGASMALEALAFFGRDDATQYGQLGVAALGRGQLPMAAQEFERSLARRPSADAYIGLARVAAQEGREQQSAQAYAAAAALEAAPASSLFKAGIAWRSAGRPELAVPVLAQAAALEPGNGLIQEVLELARRDAARSEGAAPAGRPESSGATP